MNSHDQVILTTDLALVINSTYLVLIRRAKPPFMDKFVLPGGHVEEGETLAEACAREAVEEIGFKVNPNILRLLAVLDDPKRDPRHGRRVSVVFTVDVTPRALCDLAAGSDAASLELRSIASLQSEEMGFDHFKVIQLLRQK